MSQSGRRRRHSDRESRDVGLGRGPFSDVQFSRGLFSRDSDTLFLQHVVHPDVLLVVLFRRVESGRKHHENVPSHDMETI